MIVKLFLVMPANVFQGLYLRQVIKLKIISFFLCLLLTLQVLPIAQIGNTISKNQWTEELPHNTEEPGKADLAANFNHPFLPPVDHSAPLAVFSETKALAYIHFSDQIPSNHSTEVVTPPPDAVS